ncbi:MAG: hypothetical protein WD118_10155 [Phycisphaeraceae bacterium]
MRQVRHPSVSPSSAVVLLLALMAAALPGVACADDGEMGPTRPPWQSNGPNIRDADWRYAGPVDTIYTADNAPDAPAVDALEQVESITQYGITWTFEQPVRAGQFVTGDWYIVGPATVVQIDPKPLFGDEVKDHPDWEIINERAVTEDRFEGAWARHGSVLNMQVSASRSAFDSRLAHRHYDPEQFAHLPISMESGDALISTISAPDPLGAYSGHGQPVLAAAVLTSLEAPVPADAFRPAYVDREQHIYLARNLQRQRLHALPRVDAAPANLSEWARFYQRPWLDIVAWGYANPELNSPRYGQRITQGTSQASLLLHMDYPALDKEQLLIGFMQYSIDLWGMARAAGEAGERVDAWTGHGGFGGGRKWAIMFGGLLFDDESMSQPTKTYPSLVFGEDTQTADGQSWTGHDTVFTSHPRWADESLELHRPEDWAAIREENGRRRGFQSDGYRRCCTSIVWPGQALVARIMRAEEDWDHEPFFRYVDRWMEEEDIQATARVVEAARGNDDSWTFRQLPTDPFQQEMWDMYRHDLPPAKP